MSSIKSKIQNHIHLTHLKKYNELLSVQKNSYLTYKKKWDRKTEGKFESKELSEGSFFVMEVKDLNFDASFRNLDRPYVLFVSKYGYADEKAFGAFKKAFEENPDTDVLYAHEDLYEKDTDGSKKCDEPWFKPEYSPDTLLSYFYMGNIVAVRTKALEKIEYTENLYDAVLKLTDNSKAKLVDLVLFHFNGEYKDKYFENEGHGKECNQIKEDALKRRNINAKMVTDHKGYSHIMLNNFDKERNISIVIPSKDHPDILERCVKSVREKSTYKNYDIVVVDNGSNSNNKALTEALSMKYSFTYIYEPMEFNFSKMCNMGVKASKGKYILLLNDDMEVITGDWLERLLSAVLMPGVGSAGAKLLYPDSSLIQHAGITNMYEGPAHKMLREDDNHDIYHGRNRADLDVIGVTAACLLVSRENYDSVNGLDENFKVAYNDVDFEFKLIDKGLNNVIRNDVLLYHYESLSRGDDNMDDSKKARLRSEGERLYDNHPEFYDYDPFYSKHLTGVSGDYRCSLPYENRNVDPVNKLKSVSGANLEKNFNETLIIGVDHARKERHAFKGQEKCYLVDVHAHVRNLDSADYSYKMILKGDNIAYEVPCTRRFRPDVEKIINNQIHVELSGFVARIPERLLKNGQYEIWMEAKSIYSRQTLCNKWAGGTLNVQ